MKPRSAADLLAKLTDRVRRNLALTEGLRGLPSERLNQRPGEGRWSALEAAEHLNRYGAFYVPALRRAVDAAPPLGAAATFTSGWLGNQFAAGMKPGPRMRKVSTFPSKSPLGSALTPAVLDTLADQQRELLRILADAAGRDLTRPRVPTTIARLLTIRLGDALRTVIYHDWRHLEQAARAAQLAY